MKTIVVLSFSLITVFLFFNGILYLEYANPQNSTQWMPDDTIFYSSESTITPISDPVNKYKTGKGDLSELIDTIEVSQDDEGDLPIEIEYTPNGQKLIVLYKQSNNLYIYDANTYETIGYFDVGVNPMDMFVDNESVYVCCYSTNDVYVINHCLYTIEKHFFVDSHPIQIVVNEAGTMAYIGFYNGDNDTGYLAAYNLESFEKIFTQNDVFIGKLIIFDGYIGRTVPSYSNYFLVANDEYISCIYQDDGHFMFIDAYTGEILKLFSFNSISSTISPGKDTVYVLRKAYRTNVIEYYCIDAQSMEIIDSIFDITYNHPTMGIMEENIVIDATGKKIYFETNDVFLDNIGYLADFKLHKDKEFTDLPDYIPHYYIKTSFDRKFAIMPGQYLGVFDFDHEDFIYYELVDNPIAMCKNFALSPVTYEFAWHDHSSNVHYSKSLRGEYIDIYDFSDPYSVFKKDSILCGENPELDLCYDVKYSSKYNMVVTANPLSGTVGFFNATNYSLDTVMYIKGINQITAINEELFALSGYLSEYLYVLDLSKMEIIKSFLTEDPYDFIVINNTGENKFYSYDRNNNYLVRYLVEGENIIKDDELYIEDSYYDYYQWDKRYYPEISPDGQYIVFHKNGNFKIVSTVDDLEMVKSIHDEEYAYDMVFTHDSKRVCIAQGHWTKHFSVIYLDGPDSYLEHRIESVGLGGLAVGYNSVDDKFYLACMHNIYVADPETGEIEGTIDYSVNSWIMQVETDLNGSPIILTENRLYYNDMEVGFGSPTRYLTNYKDEYRCFIPSPGPDRVYILNYKTAKIDNSKENRLCDPILIFPNPADININVKSAEVIESFKLFDTNGSLVLNMIINKKKFVVNTSSLVPGLYFIQCYSNGNKTTRKIIIK